MDQAASDRMLTAAAEADEARHQLQRQRRSEFFRLLAIVVALGLGLGWASEAVSVISGGPEHPLPLSPRVFVMAQHAFAGRLSPYAELMAVSAAVGVCATINVALAVEHTGGDHRAQVAISAWRKWLQQAALWMCLGALGAGIAVWANIERSEDVGSAAATSLLAGVTVLLGVSVRQQVNSADRASGYRRAKTTLDKLNAWDRELDKRGMPRRIDALEMPGRPALWWRRCRPTRAHRLGAARMTDRRAMWWQCVRAGTYRLPVAGLVAIGYLAVLIAAENVLGHHRMRLSWGLGFVFLAYFAVAVGFGAAVMFWTISRRWMAYTTDRVRWHLDVKPLLTRALVVSVIVAALLLLWLAGGGFVSLCMVGLLALAPGVVVATLWSSRRRPDVGWLQEATWPVGALVQLSLHDARTTAEHALDRLEMEEIARAA